MPTALHQPGALAEVTARETGAQFIFSDGAGGASVSIERLSGVGGPGSNVGTSTLSAGRRPAREPTSSAAGENSPKSQPAASRTKVQRYERMQRTTAAPVPQYL